MADFDPTNLGTMLLNIGGVPIPKPDPRGSTWEDRLVGMGVSNDPETGPYIPADAFMRKRNETLIDKIIDPNEIMRQYWFNELNGNKISPWHDLVGQRFT